MPPRPDKPAVKKPEKKDMPAPPVVSKKDDPTPAALAEKGRSATKRREFVEARDAFLAAAQACKPDREGHILRAEIYFRLAYLYTRLDPARSNEYIVDGTNLLLKQKVEKAEVNFRFKKVHDDMKGLNPDP
jgi:hypothetical protein